MTKSQITINDASDFIKVFKDDLKECALTPTFKSFSSEVKGCNDTVVIRIGANWIGAVYIQIDHDGEINSVSVRNEIRTGSLSVNQFDEMVDALKVINRIAQRIEGIVSTL
jgi:hypothetical protein